MDLKETVYALDTTTIDLCLSVFPWARFSSAKGAVKLHTLLDLRGNIPVFIHISDGKMHEVNILDQLEPEPGAFYIVDRGFLDFERLFRFHEAGSFFVTRGKANLKAQRRYSHPVDRATGLICDQTIVLTGFYSHKGFQTPLRRIRLKDPKTGKRLIFLTNNFALPIAYNTSICQHNGRNREGSEGHRRPRAISRPPPPRKPSRAGQAPLCEHPREHSLRPPRPPRSRPCPGRPPSSPSSIPKPAARHPRTCAFPRPSMTISRGTPRRAPPRRNASGNRNSSPSPSWNRCRCIDTHDHDR